ncbi:MAG: hypothetical protein GY928_20605 [Colwellia sp.]|nr:hypothetical protein [Colwellia sp.]
MAQDFPLMIYHIIHGQKIVNDVQELQLYEDRGWIKDYKTFSTQNNIIEKINYHKSELEKLEKQKSNYFNASAKNVAISLDKEMALKENNNSTDLDIETKKKVAKPKKRGRGRPREKG